MSAPDSPILDAIIRVDRLPVTGRELEVTPDADALLAIAASLGISAVERFHATMTAVPLRGGIRVQGRLTALIVQPSVVTFEPVTQDIDEPIDRVFLPEVEKPRNPAPGAEIFVDLEDEDFPDHLDGPEVDLSVLLLETLALAIDPYPRLPGESLEALGIGRDDTEEGPFAGLKSLKNPPDKDGN